MRVTAKSFGILRAFFALFLFVLPCAIQSEVAFAEGNNNYFEDTEENHKRFYDAMEAFKAPHHYDGFTEIELKRTLSEAGIVLENYKFEDVARHVVNEVYDEVVHLSSKANLRAEDVNIGFFVRAFKILTKIGISNDVHEIGPSFDELRDIMKYALGNNPENPTAVLEDFKKIEDAHKTFVNQARLRNLSRVNSHNDQNSLKLFLGREFAKSAYNQKLLIDSTFSSFESAREKGLDWVDEVKERMEKRALGQPEAIEAFLHLEYERVMKPQRDKPKVIWMLGLPGTGKDTHTEAYVDALHGYKGAHKEHIFKINPARKEADAWKLFGSNTGYVGSDKLSPLVRFLVKHSGGRYVIPEGKEYVKEVMKPDASKSPDSAVLFVNELHNWSREAIDIILKEPLEKGTFPINNAGQGVSMLEVPITIVIASNDGMGLIRPEGHAEGRKLTYEQLIEIWEKNRRDHARIRQDIMSKNSIRSGEVRDTNAGISEEVLDRIPNEGLVLLRPLSPEVIEKVAKLQLQDLADDLALADNILGKTKFVFGENVALRIKEFLYNPEEGARRVEGKVTELVKKQIYAAIKEKKLTKSLDPRTLQVDIKENDNGTWRLDIQEVDPDNKNAPKGEAISMEIDATEVLRHKVPMTDEHIDRLLEFEKVLNERIVGAQQMSKQLAEAVMAAESARHGGKKQRARRFLFLGLSSTGKTQTAKEVAKQIYGDAGDLVTIDFNGIVSEHQVRDLLFGQKNGQPSEFMKAYDRKNGKLVILFDEIANVANPNILTPFYQFLDEASINGFNDGRARSMEGVTIVMTGNAGEEIFHGIPKNAPELVQRAAYAEVYRKFMNNAGIRRHFLEQKFREAFLNRIGDKNTFFFAPLDYAGVRELIQLKLNDVLLGFKKGNGRNYNVLFKSKENFEKALDVFELEGFVLKEQGRSIEKYVSEEFHQKLLHLLMQNKVPDGSDVVLEYGERVTEGERDTKKDFEEFKVYVPSSEKPLTLKLDTKHVPDEELESWKKKIQTAFHEAGHEIARRTFLNDVVEPEKISMIPGVAEINGQYVYYAGIAVGKNTNETGYTKEFFLSHLAKLIAGGEAQRLINQGHKDTAGQSNDLERAHRTAQEMIVRYGLDGDDWGFKGPGQGETVSEFIKNLSDEKKRHLEKRVDFYMKKAKAMAHEALAINYKAFVRLAIELAQKGEIYADEIEKVYSETKTYDYWKMSWLQRKIRVFNFSFLRTWAQGFLPNRGRDTRVVSGVHKLKKANVVSTKKSYELIREKSIEKTRDLMKEKPYIEGQPKEVQKRCASLFAKVG